jgi:hypothetical protein
MIRFIYMAAAFRVCFARKDCLLMDAQLSIMLPDHDKGRRIGWKSVKWRNTCDDQAF